MLALKSIQAEQEVHEIVPFVTEKPWTFVLAHENDSIADSIELRLNDVLKERLAGRPLAYIIGEWSFFGRHFSVDERVLIPREDTEVLVRVAKEWIQRKGYQTALDLCTGSGCVGVTLALETTATVSACDISQDVLMIAKENAKQLDVQVDFFQSDLFSRCAHSFDAIISNPPYISNEDYEALQKEVQEFEPKLALLAGNDGLDYYKRIIKEAKQYINAFGLLALEIGIGQSEAVRQLLNENGWHDIKIEYDLAGIKRVIFAFAPE